MNTTDHNPIPSETGLASPPCNGGLSIGLISNPHSGRNRKQFGTIADIVANHSRIHHRPTSHPDEIPAAMQELAEASVDVLAINGGDGTIARVLSHLLQHSPFEKLPLVALLPGGTTNMNAGDVGLRGTLAGAIKRLCRWSDGKHGNCRLPRRPVLRVEPGPDQPAVYGMFFGAGVIIQGTEYCREHIHTKGMNNELGHGMTTARMIWGLLRNDPRFAQPVAVSIAWNDQPAQPAQELQLLMVSGLERLVLGAHPYWGRENGPLHVTLIRHGAERLLRSFPSLLRGKPGRHATEAAGYSSHNVERISFTMDGTFVVDGELYQASSTAGPVIVSNGGEITFLQL